MAKTRAQQAAIAISMKKAGKKPKMKNGGRTVVKSESGNYKTITKDDNTKVRRTVKGVISRATPVKETETNRAAYVKDQKKSNLTAAKRLESRYLTQTGGKNIQGAKNIYDKTANQPITIPKTKEYGDYKKGGVIKKKKK